MLHSACVLCRPLPLHRTRALCADPNRFTARERCAQTRAAKIHVACKSGMDRSYVAPVSPHARAARTLAAQIHAACRCHFSKGSAACDGRLASERHARMSWAGPSTCFTARACCADPCRFTARARCAQTQTASPRASAVRRPAPPKSTLPARVAWTGPM